MGAFFSRLSQPLFRKEPLGNGMFDYRQSGDETIPQGAIKTLFDKSAADMQEISFNPLSYVMGYSSSAITAETKQEWLQCIKDYKQGPLNRISIKDFYYDEQSLLQFLQAIVDNSVLSQQLEELDLSNNPISRQTLDFIKQTLIPSCPKLSSITLKGQPAGDAGAGRGPGPNADNNIEDKYKDECEELSRMLSNRLSTAASSALQGLR